MRRLLVVLACAMIAVGCARNKQELDDPGPLLQHTYVGKKETPTDDRDAVYQQFKNRTNITQTGGR